MLDCDCCSNIQILSRAAWLEVDTAFNIYLIFLISDELLKENSIGFLMGNSRLIGCDIYIETSSLQRLTWNGMPILSV